MKKITKNKLKYLLPSIFIAVVIFLLSSRQRISISDRTFINFAFFKSLHMLEYGIFLIFNFRAILNTLTTDKKKAGKIALIITILYGLSDEFHQTFVPTREGMLRDVIFDTIGAVVALYFIWNLQVVAPKKLLNWAKKLEII